MVTQKSDEEATPPWDAARVNLTSKKLAPNVFAVMPDDVLAKDHVGTTGGFVIGERGVLVIESMLNGDLVVWVPDAKVLWVGNMIQAPSPALPWLLEGRHKETIATLTRVRDFLPEEATIIPGHGRPMRPADIEFPLRYLRELDGAVRAAIDAGRRYGFSSINTIGLTRDGPVFGPPGYEVVLLYIAGLLSFILGGAGIFSVDSWIIGRLSSFRRLPRGASRSLGAIQK